MTRTFSHAAGRAIKELRPGEVKDYLRGHEAEVMDMLLTEYDEERTLKAEYYVGKRAGREEGLQEGLEKGLRFIMESAVQGTIPVATAAQMAVPYGITNEADLRRRAAELGIQLPE